MLFPCMKRCKSHSLKYIGLLEIIGTVAKRQVFLVYAYLNSGFSTKKKGQWGRVPYIYIHI